LNKFKNIPLFVDLDGTLISTDTLLESLVLFIKKYPLKIFKIFLWLMQGKAMFKYNIAKAIIPQAKLLPYRKAVLDHLKKERDTGRKIYLLTAANQKIANSVAKHLGIFDGVFGSTKNLNLSGIEKVKTIKKDITTGQFDYIGNSREDLIVWEKANKKILVDTKNRIENKLSSKDNTHILVNRKSMFSIKLLLRGMRLHQWSKNILLFLPILMAHQLTNTESILSVIWAFLSFSLCASSVYIFNDLLDVETDRKHPTKRNRPLASGAMSIITGIFLIVFLLCMGIGIAIVKLSTTFLFILFIYMISTTAYSLVLKQILLIDVIVLGGLYTLRVVAGSVASMVEVSSWLLVFSMFFFLSLAFMKRYADLILMKKNKYKSIAGRGYSIADLDLVQKTGVTSGFVSILVLALYINSIHVIELYKSPILIWFTLPVLLYWLMRMWMVTNRGEMTDDPIIYAAKDKISYVSISIIIIIMFLAATIDKEIFNHLHII